MNVIVLNGHEMTSPKNAHEHIAKTLNFPEYYGENLDALADCLAELNSKTYIVLYGVKDMRRHLKHYADKLLEVFEDVSQGKNGMNFILCD